MAINVDFNSSSNFKFMSNQSIRFYHLNYEIDKKRYADFFWKNYQKGEWYAFPKPKLMWWKLYTGVHEATIDLQHELNIQGMDNHPRYQYQFPNTRLGLHIDEDALTGILFNLREKDCCIHILNQPYYYQSVVTHVGKHVHSVEPDPEERLVLKFSIRHPWEEVMEKLDKKNLIKY